jgi:DivIVA domain-containing protein
MRGKKRNEEQQDPQEQGAPARSATPAAGVERNRITPVDIQAKEFRPALRGYNERDVDAFLDEVTEEVARLHAENKRLREEMGTQGTTRLDTGAATQAEEMLRDAREEAEGALRDGREEAREILREAREEAARILAEAEAKAAADATATAVSHRPGPDSFASSRTFINAFLARERDFLQSLAGLIQGHAESVKEDIRVSREQAKRGISGGTTSGQSTAAGPGQSPGPGPGQFTAAPVRATGGPGAGGSGAAGGSGSHGGEGGTAFDEGLTQPWRPSSMGADRPEGPDATDTTATPDQPRPGAVATSTIAADSAQEGRGMGGEAVLDLTKVEEDSSPRDVAGPDDTRQEARQVDEEEPTDRSLRELFWGED